MTIALLVLPDFLLIALGWVLCRYLGYARAFFEGLEKLVYYVLLPALLLQSILRTPLSLGTATELFSATALLIAAGVALAWLARPILKPSAIALASSSQCGYRFNTYIGLALAANLGNGEGQTIMAVILGFGIPMVNVAAVYGLARQGGQNLLRALASNPLLLSTVLALIGNFAGLSLPTVVDIVLGRLGGAALAVGILCVGAGLIWENARGAASLIAWMLAVKLLALPAVALLIARVLGLDAVQQNMLLLFAALPTASTTYVLAMRMGGDGRIVAQLVSLGTVFSAVTIPLWLTWLR